jgi:acetyltransferase-like isoleucine patch superfamily enzyme
MKKVIVYGSAILSQMLFNDCIGDPTFVIACFTMDDGYRSNDQLVGLPLVRFADIHTLYPPGEYDMLALFDGYTHQRDRAKMYDKAKSTGYTLRNYISFRADVAPDISIGDNNVIMALSHVGFGGTMGNNNLIRQNVYLGHQFIMGSHNIITAGCTLGGRCQISNNCYIGLGSTVLNSTRLADETLVGAGSVVIRDTEPCSKNVGNPSRVIGYHKEEGVRMKVREG